MNVIVLSSMHPKFGHVKAGYLALASILEELALAGHRVKWVTLAPPAELDKETESRLKAVGVEHFANFSKSEIFLHPKKTVAKLMESKTDVFILFWDTAFEYLAQYIKSVPVIGYLCSMPFRAAMTRLKHRSKKNLKDRVMSWVHYRVLAQREKWYWRRIRHVTKASSLAEVEAKCFTENGLPCIYIPNTFPDMFGADWFEKRKRAESKMKRFGLLGNIGLLFGTANTFGLHFLADSILPNLQNVLPDVDWEINICGQGTMDEELRKKLMHPRVNIKGFVDDIDAEMLSSPILLVLNNVGPLVTGFTRIIYAFSSGSCVIAHKDICKSMPEIKHRINALLGESAEEILELIKEAAHDKDLRARLGANARKTYELEYYPRVIASKLINLIMC